MNYRLIEKCNTYSNAYGESFGFHLVHITDTDIWQIHCSSSESAKSFVAIDSIDFWDAMRLLKEVM